MCIGGELGSTGFESRFIILHDVPRTALPADILRSLRERDLVSKDFPLMNSESTLPLFLHLQLCLITSDQSPLDQSRPIGHLHYRKVTISPSQSPFTLSTSFDPSKILLYSLTIIQLVEANTVNGMQKNSIMID